MARRLAGRRSARAAAGRGRAGGGRAGLSSRRAHGVSPGVPLVTGAAALASLVALVTAPIGQATGGPGASPRPTAALARPLSTRRTARPCAGVPSESQRQPAAGPNCYAPQIRTAYDMEPLHAAGDTGKGETIVLVESFGSPTIRSDLKTFDKKFGLPAPPSFTIVTPAGPIPAWTGNSAQVGWGIETSLDVEWATPWRPGRASCWPRPPSTRP